VVLMQVINKLIWYSLTQMINLEKNHTHTDAIISQMTKSSVMILINIIVLPIVVYQILE
jgi:nitric oxide reductase large subunit